GASGKAKWLEAWFRTRQPVEDGPRRIARSIVDDDQLPRKVPIHHRRADLVDQAREVLGLVVRPDDDAQVHASRRPRPGPGSSLFRAHPLTPEVCSPHLATPPPTLAN